jgi:hypothetical protein
VVPLAAWPTTLKIPYSEMLILSEFRIQNGIGIPNVNISCFHPLMVPRLAAWATYLKITVSSQLSAVSVKWKSYFHASEVARLART